MFIITGEKGHYGCLTLTGYERSLDDYEIAILLILSLPNWEYKPSTGK